MTSPGELTLPSVAIPIVDGKGCLTEYGRRMLLALVMRTGGAGIGDSLEQIRVYLEGELQSDREAPVPNLLEPPTPPDDQPALLSIPAVQEDNLSIGLLIAYIQRLESRIQELEESR